MKQSEVIAVEMSVVAPKPRWWLWNGWPVHCGQFAKVAPENGLCGFVCVVCNERIANSELPAS